MRRRTLTELADNPELISGIYNYCDRWCERCSFTSRCLVYATEQEDEDDSPESHDVNNEAFWVKLSSIFQETREMICAWAEEAGVDLNNIDEESGALEERRHTEAQEHRLAVNGKEYAEAVTQWFTEFDEIITVTDAKPTETDEENAQQILDAREVIHWYQYQIAVKTMRALSSRSREQEPSEWEDDDRLQKDSDGSAKVALVGIDRSIGAWRIMQCGLPDRAHLVVPLILQLEQLRVRTEREFPEARSFIRPGFDEILGKAN
jgi:hypothetical protein